MNLTPYPAYKDSGVPWLGEVPEHWEVRRLKHFAKINPNIEDKSEKPFIVSFVPMTKVKENYPWFSTLEGRYADLEKGFTNFRDQDVLIAKITPCFENGKGGICKKLINGIGFGSTEFHVVRTGSKLMPEFFYYLSISSRFRYFGQEHMQGSAGQKRIPTDLIETLRFGLPPLSEQTHIARFLDWKTAQINKFIRNKKRLIELLKEQKQVIINDVVTGKYEVKRIVDADGQEHLQASPRPPEAMRPSGVEWLGDVPKGWDATKLKRVVSFNPSKSETRANPTDEEKVVFLPMENISVNGDIDCSEKRTLPEVWNGFTYFRRGDVVVAKITPCFENGKGAYLKGLESDFGFGTTELIVLRPSKAIDGAFLRFLTSTKQFLLLGEQYMTGAAGQQRIPSDFVKNYPIALPPINQQLEILEHIQKKSTEIDHAITRAEREISLIQEYRTRLVSDVVTGKVDVRAIEVPEFAEEELLALDEDGADVDDLIDGEGDMDETG